MILPPLVFLSSLIYFLWAKKGAYPLSIAPERCFTLVGSCLTCQHYTIQERLTRDKHSSLLRKLITYARKKVYNIGPRGLYHKTLFTDIQNKLEFLSLASLSSLVYCWQVRPEPTWMKHLTGAPLKGRPLALPKNIKTRLERLARDKHLPITKIRKLRPQKVL